MAHARTIRFMGLLLGVSAMLSCRGIYRTFTDCKELRSFLKAVPNTCALFVDGGGGNKKRMLRRLESDYTDMNVRFAIVDVRASGMRRCAEDLYVLQYPAFGIFKGSDLVKIVRGNPSDDDVRQQVTKQLSRDPQNWALLNNRAFHMCNWAQRQKQADGALTNQCKQEVLPYMGDWKDVRGILPDEQAEQVRDFIPEQLSGVTNTGSGVIPQSSSNSGQYGNSHGYSCPSRRAPSQCGCGG